MLPLGIRRPNIHAKAHERNVRVVEPRRVVVDAANVPEGELDGFVVDRDADGLGDAALVLFCLNTDQFSWSVSGIFIIFEFLFSFFLSLSLSFGSLLDVGLVVGGRRRGGK